MGISCGSWFNTAYVYVGIPFACGFLILFVMMLTVSMSPETQLGFISVVSLFTFFLIPYLIKKRIDDIKYDCHEMRPVVMVPTIPTTPSTDLNKPLNASI